MTSKEPSRIATGAAPTGAEERPRPPSDPTRIAGSSSDPAAVVLGACCALGLAIALASAIGLAGQTRDLQTAAFLACYGLLLPIGAALTLVALRRPPRSGAAAALAAGSVLVGLIAGMRVADLAGIEGSVVSAAGIAGGIAIAAGAAALALGRVRPRLPSALAPARRPYVAAGLVIIALLAFVPAQLGAAAVLAALLVAGAATRLRRPSSWPSPRGRAGAALDLALIALAALLVIDLTGYWGPDAGASTWANLDRSELAVTAQFHQHFYLGPIGDILAGRALLVDADSVYGIGNAYVLAGWFQLVPFGYGPFGLFGSLASAGAIVAGWTIMRLAGVGRVIAAVTVLLAVMVTVLAPIASPGLFLNVGGLRFGPPLLLVLVAVAVCGRAGPVSRSPAVLLTFGFFSLWSVEAVAYCGTAMLALALADGVAARSPRDGVRVVAGSVGLAIATFVAAHLLLALLTLAASGELPDWAGYFALFSAWAEILETTFGSEIEAWSRAWVAGSAYLVSGLGAVVLLLRGGDRNARRRAIAVAGTSAVGASFLSYFIAHSVDLFLPYVVLPGLLLGAIWVQIAVAATASWRRGALAAATFAAVLLLLGAWSDAARRLPRTALAHVVPGGASLTDDLRRMWGSPAIDPRAPAAEALIEENIPGDRAVVLVEPDLGQEALIRTDRANELPISYPWQDEVVLDRSLPPVIEAIDELPLGTRALLQDAPAPGAPPSVALRTQRAIGNVPPEGRLGPLAAAAEAAIRDRFELRVVDRGPDGLFVAELESRR